MYLPQVLQVRRDYLLINSLVERVNRDKIEEVILATSATVEGQTTAYYIQDSLKKLNVKITKLAQGLPVGGEIESLDDGTLFSAFKNRSNLVSNSDQIFFSIYLNEVMVQYNLKVAPYL